MIYVDNTETQRYISICTGYEGLGLGLEETGQNFKPIAYVEIEAFAVANLVAKIEENKLAPAPIWTNVKTFPAENFHGKVHGIIGGYPCQPFSIAGNMEGEKDPRHLWPHIKRTVRAIKPPWCFFENVFNHLNLGLDSVVRDLQEMGYIVEAGIFSASEVGAVHQRKRIFILAHSMRLRGRRWNQNLGVHSGRQITKNKTKRSGTSQPKLGDTQHNGSSSGKITRSTQETIRDSEKGKNCASEFKRTSESKELADNSMQGLERATRDGIQKRCSRSSFSCVARPGEQQHEWEEPRTIESSMGRTIDGVASRVDELRLLGNGVYPDTATKAWIILNQRISKHQ